MPSILHTPLMSGSNAIHGIVLVGALTIMGEAHGTAEVVLGFLAVFLATLNVVGGFVVTDRMLEMFKAKPGDRARPQAAKAEDAGQGAPGAPSPAGAPPDAGRVLHPDDRARPGLPGRHRRLHLRPEGPELAPHARRGNLVGAAAADPRRRHDLHPARRCGTRAGTSSWPSSPWCSARPSPCRWPAS